MRCKIKSVVADNTSCNFCDKGVLNRSGTGLSYPYVHVTTFQRNGSGLIASICNDCLKELNEFAKDLK